MSQPILPVGVQRGAVDVNALVQQNEQLKTFIGILVMRLGGDVRLGPIEIQKALSDPMMVTCDKLPGSMTAYRLTSKRL